MSTPDYDNDFLNDDDEPQPNGPRQLREAMRRAQEQATEAAARAEAAERRATFAEAGLTSLTPAQRTLLSKGYEGDMTPEAIRAFAQEAGFLAPPPPADIPDDSADAQSRIAAAAGTAAPVPTADARIAELEAAAAQGKDALEAQMRKHGMSFL